MPVLKFFDYEPFHFETMRALWYAPSGGADLGEVLSAARAIKDREVNSWFDGWARLARRRVSEADAASDSATSGNARLRASNYMRTAEFFLPPKDVRRQSSSEFAQRQFFAGLDALRVRYQRLFIPYDGVDMEAIYLPAENASTLLVVHGGFDSTPEEMFFMLGRAAQARGCDVLIYEGPGQGNLLRKHARPFHPDWGRALTAALDAAPLDLADRMIVGVGVSMGGHFLARAAASEKRLDAIVLCDYFPAPIEAFKFSLPHFMRASFVKKAPWALKLMEMNARSDVQTRWVIDNAMWTFGASSIAGLVDKLKAFDEGAWVNEITADVLLMLGAQEHFYDIKAADVFASRLRNARSVTKRVFSVEEGGELHCRNGAYYLVQNGIFDWLSQIGSARAASCSEGRTAAGAP